MRTTVLVNVVIASLLSSTSVFADGWYWGLGVTTSDFTDLTVTDRELSSLTIAKDDQEPIGFTLFAGHSINNNMALEFSLDAQGEQVGTGSVSGATVTTRTNTYSIAPTLVFRPSYSWGGFTPYARVGFAFSYLTSETTKQNAVGVFSNPNNVEQSEIGANLVYGFGATYQLSQRTAMRLDWTIHPDSQTDYINNIDNGNVERAFTTIGLHVVYNYNPTEADQNDVGSRVGLFLGNSNTDARLSGGAYSGNIYNLTTGAVAASVSGAMSDDKSSRSRRVVFFQPMSNGFEMEFHATNYGVFQSRSANLGITGGGNALTGAATRSVMSFNAQAAYPIEIGQSFLLSPSIGLGVFYTEDEIYNNLEFDGVGGSDRGPQSTSTSIRPVVGLMGSMPLSDTVALAIRYDYAHDVGHNSGLGRGSISTTSFGIITSF